MLDRLEKIAQSNGVGWANRGKGKYVEFYIQFLPNDDYIWHKYSLLLRWERRADGKLNWWEDWVFDGRHHISGPGYSAHEQKAVDESTFLSMVEKAVERNISIYKDEYRWYV